MTFNRVTAAHAAISTHVLGPRPSLSYTQDHHSEIRYNDGRLAFRTELVQAVAAQQIGENDSISVEYPTEMEAYRQVLASKQIAIEYFVRLSPQEQRNILNLVD